MNWIMVSSYSGVQAAVTSRRPRKIGYGVVTLLPPTPDLPRPGTASWTARWIVVPWVSDFYQVIKSQSRLKSSSYAILAPRQGTRIRGRRSSLQGKLWWVKNGKYFLLPNKCGYDYSVAWNRLYFDFGGHFDRLNWFNRLYISLVSLPFKTGQYKARSLYKWLIYH